MSALMAPEPLRDLNEDDGPPPYPPGARLAAGYSVIEHFNRGQSLDCYDAWSHGRYSRCFIKTLRPDRLDDERDQARLRREGDLLLRLTHPHLGRAYELVETSETETGAPLLVLETHAGGTLSELLERGRRLIKRDIAFLGTELCSALRYLHDNGFLHLDVKPSNIVVEGGATRLIDLSLARPPGRYSRGIGTDGYRSPEQASGGELGPPADVWGVGVILYRAATGVRPFGTAQSESETVSGARADEAARQASWRVPPVRALRRLPAPMARAIDASLDPDPANRPTLAELSAVLFAHTDEAPLPEGGS